MAADGGVGWNGRSRGGGGMIALVRRTRSSTRRRSPVAQGPGSGRGVTIAWCARRKTRRSALLGELASSSISNVVGAFSWGFAQIAPIGGIADQRLVAPFFCFRARRRSLHGCPCGRSRLPLRCGRRHSERPHHLLDEQLRLRPCAPRRKGTNYRRSEQDLARHDGVQRSRGPRILEKLSSSALLRRDPAMREPRPGRWWGGGPPPPHRQEGSDVGGCFRP